jgi:hypothetical protein
MGSADGQIYVPREGMAHHKVPVDAQLLSELADLVFEHLPERLDQF